MLFCFILRLATTHFLNGKELLTTNTASGIPAYVFSLAGNGGNSIVSVVAIVRSASKQFGLVEIREKRRPNKFDAWIFCRCCEKAHTTNAMNSD